MGRDYPDPNFRQKCHNVFMKNKDVKDPKEIEQLLNKGDYIIKEIEALFMLKKYRTLKRRYYDNEEAERAQFRHLEQIMKEKSTLNVTK